MNKNKIFNFIFLIAIVITSFFLYSSRYYPLLNSDDALNILMTYYYDLPNDFYCWGQDRGGTLIPLISQFFHKICGFSAVLSTSFSNYLLLALGYIGFSSLFKNNTTKLLFALVWFFPPMRFIDLTRFPIGVQYSLVGISIYLINNLDFINKKSIYNHLLLIGVLLLFFLSIWVSDLAIVTITVLVIVLSIYYFLIEKQNRLRNSILLYGIGGIIGISAIIRYFKTFATAVTASYAKFNDWNSFKGAIGILKIEFAEVLSFQNDEIFFSLYAWFAILFCVFLVYTFANKKFLKLLKSSRWVAFFIVDFFAIFGVILLSKWVYLNGMGRWYFVTSYISLSMFVLLLFDRLELKRIKSRLVKASLLLTILIGSFSTIHYLKFIRPKSLRSQISLRSEFLRLGNIGIIGEFWNSYISACPDPSRIKATSHDKSNVRNHKLVDEVFAQPKIYVMKDMWMKEYPDTLLQFGYTLKKNGPSFRVGDYDVNEYDRIKRNQKLKFNQFKLKESVSITKDNIIIPKDSADLKNAYVVYGPYMPLGVGDYFLKIKFHAENIDRNKPLALFDVASDYGNNILVRKEIHTAEDVSDSTLVELQFSCENRVKNLEFRIFNYGTADLFIEEIKLIER